MNQNDISIVQRAIDCIHSAKLCEFNSMSSRREQLRLMDEAIATLRSALQKGCSHCTHPLYAGIRCGVCGRWTDKLTPEEITELREGKKAIAEYVKNTLHTCSYECARPECIRAQRDELRAKVEANTAEIRRYHRACEMALEALDSHGTGSFPYRRDAAIDALREVLGEKKCGRRKVCERTADGYCARCHEGMY